MEPKWLAGLMLCAGVAALSPTALSGSGGGPASLAPEITAPALADDVLLERIAFGSCLHQARPQSILDPLLGDDPDLMLFMGDNVYGDVRSPELTELRDAYRLQATSGPMNALRSAVPVLATWDDHDYGLNDAGADFPHGAESRRMFAAFWQLDEAAFAAEEGVYRARIAGPPGRRVQIILLDTRSFRSPLKVTDARGAPGRERYLPDPDPAKTMLGDAQWAWLEAQLAEPADLRLLVTSIQLIADGHGWEAWRTLPTERLRLYALLRESAAENLVVLSGDRHRAGIYRHDEALAYPLYEITSSALNMPIPEASEEAGPLRLGETYTGANYGRIDVDWEAGRLWLQILDESGRVVRAQDLALERLRLPEA